MIENNDDLILAKARSLGYKTPKKVLEIYEETEEENRAAIRELDKQLLRMKEELVKKTGQSSNIQTPVLHARRMEKFWEDDAS